MNQNIIIDKYSSIPSYLPYGQIAHTDSAFLVGGKDGKPRIYSNKPTIRQIKNLIGSSNALFPGNHDEDEFVDFIPMNQTLGFVAGWPYGDLPINAINQGSKQITVTGNATVSPGEIIRVDQSDNNGAYTVSTANISGPDTIFTVLEDIPSPNVNGNVDFRYYRTYINYTDKFPFSAHSILLYARSFDGNADNCQAGIRIRRGGPFVSATGISVVFGDVHGNNSWGDELGLGDTQPIQVTDYDPVTGQAYIDMFIQSSTGVDLDTSADRFRARGFFI